MQSQSVCKLVLNFGRALWPYYQPWDWRASVNSLRNKHDTYLNVILFIYFIILLLKRSPQILFPFS